MRRIILWFAALVAVPLLLSRYAECQMVTTTDALGVANNWIQAQISRKGDWGGSTTASVADVSEFRSGERLLGYFCRVEPHGFIVVSLRKEFSAIKAYDETSNPDPGQDTGLMDVIKLGMDRMIEAVERRLGPIGTIAPGGVSEILEIDGRATWLPANDLSRPASSYQAGGNYSEGNVALTTRWNQRPPFNNNCPEGGCDWQYYDYFNSRTRAGCGAIAAAQIMRYWAWPPQYSWNDMLDWYYYNTEYDQFWTNDADHIQCTPAQLDAVAEVVADWGAAAGMDYGCDESTVLVGGDIPGPDALDAFEDHFKFHSDGDYEPRDSHDAEGWFGIVQENLNTNQLIFYRIATNYLLSGHIMVLDGWQIVDGHRQYHMNYGWDFSDYQWTTWYTIDNLHDSQNYLLEGMIRNLRPECSLGSWVHGDYPAESYPYRYFDRDCTGDSAAFSQGQNLQFLSGVHLACTSPNPLHSIRMFGTGYAPVRAYSVGKKNGGIKLTNGHLSIRHNGEMVIF